MDEGVYYLDLEDVLGLYADVFGCSEQEARDQLRSPDGLAGALARGETHAHYEGADLAKQAAVIAHGIAEGQYFIEGNKRTALATMRTFLAVNGWDLLVSQEERAQWMIELSEGLSVDELADRIRAALFPR